MKAHLFYVYLGMLPVTKYKQLEKVNFFRMLFKTCIFPWHVSFLVVLPNSVHIIIIIIVIIICRDEEECKLIMQKHNCATNLTKKD